MAGRPTPDEYAKFSIDGVKLKDIDNFDRLAKEAFPNSTNPRKDAFYSLYFHFRSLRDLTRTKIEAKTPGEQTDGNTQKA